ncbi:MAG: hypothetical protein ACTSPG_02140 [Candidatus Hodarchaeales archaeon]
MSNEQSKVSKIKDHMAKIESENGQIQQRIMDFTSDIKKSEEAFNRTLGQSKKEVLGEINALMSNIEQISDDLNEYKKKTLESEKAELSDRLEKLLGQITKGLQKLQKDILELSNRQEKEVSTLYSNMANKVNTGLERIYSGQRKQIDKFEKEISSRLEQIQRDIVSTVERESTNQREIVQNIASSFETALEDFRQKIRTIGDSKEANVDLIFAGTVSESVGRLEMAKEDLLAGIDGAINALEASLENQKATTKAMQDEIYEAIVRAKSDLKKRLEELREEAREEWKNIGEKEIETLSKTKKLATKNFENALVTDESFQNEILKNLEQSLKAGLYSEIDNITLSFTKYQDSIINQIDSLISRLTSTRSEMKENLGNLLVTNLSKIGNVGHLLEEELANVFEQISNSYKETRSNALSRLTKELDARFSAISESIAKYGQQMNLKLEKTTTDVDVSLMNFFDTTQKVVGEAVERNETAIDELGSNTNTMFKELQTGQEKNIETTLADIRNTLRSKQSELITTISSIAPSAEEHIDASREFITEKTSEISSQSTSAFEDLRKQVASLNTDSLGAISAIVQNTHHELDTAVKNSEEQSKALVEGLENDHKTQIAEFRAKSNQEMNQNLQMLEEYRNTLKEKFERFFEDQQKSLDLFIDSTRSRRENVDDIRRKFEVKLDELGNSIDTATDTLSKSVTTNTENVTTSINQILRSTEDVVKTLKE